MKNIRFAMMILIFVGACAACTFNVPWETMDDYDGVRVVMHVVPDDADVLLNGRFIGAAYEFASPGSALRLASRLNELVFEEKGFSRKSDRPALLFVPQHHLARPSWKARHRPGGAAAAEPAPAATAEDRPGL